MRRGNESDFDPDKMHPGEWAVSLDKKYVRMCFSVGVCVRMATYDAFEEDMAQIEEILSTCETIEEAVSKINTEVSANAQAVEEYTEQAKQYRDEAKQFRDEAEQFAPDGYIELKETVASNTAKIDTIIEKAELNIKNIASGENIHLTDSASSKVVEFGLYGKAEQFTTSGKNKLQNTATSKTEKGITFTVNSDRSIAINGTSTGSINFIVNDGFVLSEGTYLLSQAGSIANSGMYIDSIDGEWFFAGVSGRQFEITTPSTLKCAIYIPSGTVVNNVTLKPMIRLASITDSTYEPYTGGIASPNPDYPQEITVSGSDGSVEVVSCRKNLYNELTLNKEYSYGGVTLTKDAETGNLTISGTATASNNMIMNPLTLPAGTYYYQKGNVTNCGVALYNQTAKTFISTHKELSFTLTEESVLDVRVQTVTGQSPSGTIKIQIEKGSAMTEYEPYTETVSTISTPNGLAGIPVSSGGNYTDENGQQWICDEVVKYADGSGKRIQRIQKAVFDGSDDEVIRSSGVNNHGYYSYELLIANCISTKEIPASYSTHFCYKALWESDAEIFYNADGFVIVLSRFETIDLLREFLNANPVTFIVPITPIITDLTAEEIAEIEKLRTFYPITNISNDADCDMSITYLCDAKNYIDQRLALIESAMLNNI